MLAFVEAKQVDVVVLRADLPVLDAIDVRLGEADAERLSIELVGRAAAGYRDRDPELRRLDRARLLTPTWLQDPRMVGYACYTERFAGDLPGVSRKLDYLQDLGVTAIWLLPCTVSEAPATGAGPPWAAKFWPTNQA